MRMLVRAFALGVAAVLAHLPTAPGAGAQSPIKNVLIIYGGPEAYPGSATFDASLREALFAHPTIEVEAHSEYLENEEFVETADASLREYIGIKFASRRPD